VCIHQAKLCLSSVWFCANNLGSKHALIGTEKMRHTVFGFGGLAGQGGSVSCFFCRLRLENLGWSASEAGNVNFDLLTRKE
jgi:hypothetical protein